MSEWKEVQAWEALKAWQEGTHKVQTQFNGGGWLTEYGTFVAGKDWKHRIRPKVRTVDVIGLTVPLAVRDWYQVNLCEDDQNVIAYRLPVDFDTEDEARRAYEALCAASK